MEETRLIFKRVGNYSMGIANPDDCVKCKNAQWGTVIIDGLCLDCFIKATSEKDVLEKIVELAIPSLDIDGFNALELSLDALAKNRHISFSVEDILTTPQSGKEQGK